MLKKPTIKFYFKNAFKNMKGIKLKLTLFIVLSYFTMWLLTSGAQDVSVLKLTRSMEKVTETTVIEKYQN